MFLHHDTDLFREVILSTAADLQLPVTVVEKDYYVSAILRELAKKAPDCVLKGGMALTKCYHISDILLESIELSHPDLKPKQRKNLKNVIIAGISGELKLPITDWQLAKSKRDYNRYTFSYKPVWGNVPQSLVQGVRIGVSLEDNTLPTARIPVDSFVYQYLSGENADIAEKYDLLPFPIKVQTLECILAEKVFAVCDGYMTGKVRRNSRHLYDIYLLLPKVSQNDDFRRLVCRVRETRKPMESCLSAKAGVNVPELLKKIIAGKVYAEDYQTTTAYFQNKRLGYDKVITALGQIAESDIFRE